MVNFTNHQFTTVDRCSLQYIDDEVREYLQTHKRTKALDDDLMVARYYAIEEDYVNGRNWPPLHFVKFVMRLTRRQFLRRYYKSLSHYKE